MDIIKNSFNIVLIFAFAAIIQGCCSNESIVRLSHPEILLGNLESLEFTTCGMNVTSNDVTYSKKKPTIIYSFSDEFESEFQNLQHVRNLINNTFQNLFYCGKGIKNGYGICKQIEITNGDINQFDPTTKRIIINPNHPNKLLMIHEMVHAILYLENREDIYYLEEARLISNCDALNVLYHDAPGLNLDLSVRMKMNSLEEIDISNCQKGAFYLPKDSEYTEVDLLCSDFYTAIASTTFVNSSFNSNISKKEFFIKKFRDEYNYLYRINGIDRSVLMPEYVDRNITEIKYLFN